MKKTVVTGLLAATAVAYWLRFAGTSSHSGVEQAEGAAVHEMRGNPRGIRKLPSTFTAIQFTDRSKGELVHTSFTWSAEIFKFVHMDFVEVDLSHPANYLWRAWGKGNKFATIDVTESSPNRDMVPLLDVPESPADMASYFLNSYVRALVIPDTRNLGVEFSRDRHLAGIEYIQRCIYNYRYMMDGMKDDEFLDDTTVDTTYSREETNEGHEKKVNNQANVLPVGESISATAVDIPDVDVTSLAAADVDDECEGGDDDSSTDAVTNADDVAEGGAVFVASPESPSSEGSSVAPVSTAADAAPADGSTLGFLNAGGDETTDTLKGETVTESSFADANEIDDTSDTEVTTTLPSSSVDSDVNAREDGGGATHVDPDTSAGDAAHDGELVVSSLVSSFSRGDSVATMMAATVADASPADGSASSFLPFLLGRQPSRQSRGSSLKVGEKLTGQDVLVSEDGGTTLFLAKDASVVAKGSSTCPGADNTDNVNNVDPTVSDPLPRNPTPPGVDGQDHDGVEEGSSVLLPSDGRKVKGAMKRAAAGQERKTNGGKKGSGSWFGLRREKDSKVEPKIVVEVEMSVSDVGGVEVTCDGVRVVSKSGPYKREWVNRVSRLPWGRKRSDEYELHVIEDGFEICLGDEMVWDTTLPSNCPRPDTQG